jgi:hypothetical protein
LLRVPPNINTALLFELTVPSLMTTVPVLMITPSLPPLTTPAEPMWTLPPITDTPMVSPETWPLIVMPTPLERESIPA